MTQFNLRNVLQLMVVLSIYCGFSFAIPPLIGAPVLILVSILIPSAAVIGIIYGKGSVRAFWIGCAAGGFFPLLFLAYVGIAGSMGFFLSSRSARMLFGPEGFYYVRMFVVVHALIFISGAFAAVFHRSLTKPAQPASAEQDGLPSPSL